MLWPLAAVAPYVWVAAFLRLLSHALLLTYAPSPPYPISSILHRHAYNQYTGVMFSGIFPKKPDTAGEKALAQALGGGGEDDDDSGSRSKKGGGKGTGLFDPSGLERCVDECFKRHI